jgi:hypothetical protein
MKSNYQKLNAQGQLGMGYKGLAGTRQYQIGGRQGGAAIFEKWRGDSIRLPFGLSRHFSPYYTLY